jgi:hypothetical protein
MRANIVKRIAKIISSQDLPVATCTAVKKSACRHGGASASDLPAQSAASQQWVEYMNEIAARCDHIYSNGATTSTSTGASTASSSQRHCATPTAIRIADWQRQCVTLPKPITTANFKDWWNVAKLCLLEFWKSCDSGGRIYDQALSKISDRKAPKEFQKRNRAVVQVRKALRSLVGLRP